MSKRPSRLLLLTFLLGALGAPEAASALLSNPDFELGPTGWVAMPADLILDVGGGLPVTPYDGSFSAWLGGDPDANDVLSQLVSVPADMVLESLELQHWIATTETGSIPFDTLAVRLETPGGALLETLASWSNVDETTGWAAISLPIVGDYTGESVRLVFDSSNDAVFPTSFYLDALNLTLPEPSGGLPAGVLLLTLLARRRQRTRLR
ncbi:MAG: hypothetical protein ACQGVC_24090 [Myxococcota bacterium]